MILKKLAQLIPFISASLFVLTPIFQVLSQSNSITYNRTIIYTTVEDSVFYASIGLAITFILILLKKNAWKYLFLGLILLSFTHIIQFSNWSFSGSVALN